MAKMRWGTPYKASLAWFAIMNANAMYDNMANTLYCNARPICNLHFSTSSINGLVAIHDKLIIEPNNHIFGKNDPKGLCLDNTITKCAWFWAYGVIRGICDFIY